MNPSPTYEIFQTILGNFGITMNGDVLVGRIFKTRNSARKAISRLRRGITR